MVLPPEFADNRYNPIGQLPTEEIGWLSSLFEKI